MLNPQASRDRHRDRAIVGEKEKGAGPLPAFQRLYLASGVANLDRSGMVQPKPRKPGQGLIPRTSLLSTGYPRVAPFQLAASLDRHPWSGSRTAVQPDWHGASFEPERNGRALALESAVTT
jgi:hypothetical protein